MHSTLTHARERAQITLDNAAVTRGGTLVLAGVELTVGPRHRTAIVGENGRGKTTLLHLLAGRLQPDEGTVIRIGSIGLAEQEMSTDDARTVDEVVADTIADSLATLAELDAAGAALAVGDAAAETRYSRALETAEALDAWDAERRVRLALDTLDVTAAWSRPLAELSVGQRYRVRLACLLGGDDDLLLLDEPTNHLDRAGLDFLTERLKVRRGGVAIVSHDRALLADLAETIVDLDPTPDGRPRVYDDGYAGYRSGRRAELARWEQTYAEQQAERARLQRDLDAAQHRLVDGWRPPKGTGKHQRATRAGGLVQSVHRRQDALETHAVTVPEPPLAFRFPALTSRTGALLLTAHEAAVAGRAPHPVSLTLKGRDRLLITGPNGAGKSTLLAMLAGELAPTSGTVTRSPDTRVGLLRQESRLPLESRAAEAYERAVGELVSCGRIPNQDAVGLGSLGLLGPRESGKRIGELSMGQRRRLDLALVLAGRPHALLLDEPSNHLSIALVDELTEALRASDAAIAVSTHDRQLLADLADWPRLELAPAVLRA